MPCGTLLDISCRGLVNKVSWEGLELYFVEKLDYPGCVVNDLGRHVYILNGYWQRLTEEEKRGLLEHELTEIRSFKEHGDVVGAHKEALARENPDIRRRRLNICHEVRGI